MNNEKRLVQIGAGKIGRGYIADLFNEAGYRLTFLDYSPELIKSMNAQGYYTIFKHHADGTYTKVVIRDYQAYCTQTQNDQCVSAIAQASYVSINIFPGAVDSISKMLAEAIELRLRNGNEAPLDCLIGVNFLFASKLFREAIEKYLTTEAGQSFLAEKVALIECLVHRNGAFPTEEMLVEDPLACNSGDTPYMTVDNIFKNGLPAGVNLHPQENVPAWMIHKIWVANMSHSLSGYFGKKAGYTYIGECHDDPYIMRCVILAKREAVFAMHEAYGMSYEEMEAHDPVEKQKEHYLDHVANSVDKDTIDRVCGDLIRKLAKGDRLIGPALACMQHGRIPYFLARGAAMALYFNNPEDKTSVEVQQCIRENGVEQAIAKYCGLREDDAAEKALAQLISGIYYELGDQYPFDIQY